ncbi:MAG: hypothetical protein M3322_11005 [Actinomycetota bacterium]|nr:hypothetical protein [Actinomycetota bacterium]
MTGARRHPRLANAAAFGLIALAAELVGRSLTQRVDVGRHIATPSYAEADYYPFLLAGVKLGIALLLARLVWRFAKARSTARAGRRMLVRLGRQQPYAPPRLRLALSPRLWLYSFVVTSMLYLVQADAEGISDGSWALLAPLLHTSALSVFAVLSIVVALLWAAVAGWLTAYESYAEATLARAYGLAADRSTEPPRETRRRPPRLLFGLAFESRPPPVSV